MHLAQDPADPPKHSRHDINVMISSLSVAGYTSRGRLSLPVKNQVLLLQLRPSIQSGKAHRNVHNFTRVDQMIRSRSFAVSD